MCFAVVLVPALSLCLQEPCQVRAPAPADALRGTQFVHLTTQHYALQVQGGEAEATELGLVLEQAWPQFRDFFAAEPDVDPKAGPDKRLAFRLYGSREAWQSAIFADGIGAPAVADWVWFSPQTRAVYAYRHPVEYVTRAHAIHGACLQFHALAKRKNLDLATAWYIHGIAEMLSIHAWESGRLELGVARRVCALDPAARALAALGDTPWPWTEVNLQKPGAHWAIVRFARDAAGNKYRARLQKLALGSTGSKISGEEFARLLGREREVEAEFRRWLAGVQTPFEIGAWTFEERSDGRFVGLPGPAGLAFCALKAPARFLEATVPNGRDQRGSAGFVLSWEKPNDYLIARFSEPMLFIEEYAGGELVRTEPIPLAREGLGRIRVRAERSEDGVRVLADGRVLHTERVGRPVFGLAAFWGEVTFEDVAFQRNDSAPIR